MTSLNAQTMFLFLFSIVIPLSLRIYFNFYNVKIVAINHKAVEKPKRQQTPNKEETANTKNIQFNAS